MHAWIVQTGEPLPCDDADERPMRAGALTRALERNHHRVTVISSDFWHQRKRHRTGKLSLIRTSPLTEVLLLPSLGYKRHIGVRRLIDHQQLGAAFRKVAPGLERPDVMVVGFPPIEIAFQAISLAKHWGVPSVLDVKDQWPDIFWRRLPERLQGIGRLSFRAMTHQATEAFRLAGSITSMSPAFVEWAAGRAGRKSNDLDQAFPFGCDSPADHEASLVDGPRALTFAGSITRSFDFDTLLRGFQRSNFAGSGGKLGICGSGDEERRLRAVTASDERVMFRGWLSASELATTLCRSVAGAAPYIARSDFEMSLPNKVVEYTSFGLPILAPSIGQIANFVSSVGVGFMYKPTSIDDCAAAIDACTTRTAEQVARDRTLLKAHFHAHLDSSSVYLRFVKYLEALVASSRATHG